MDELEGGAGGLREGVFLFHVPTQPHSHLSQTFCRPRRLSRFPRIPLGATHHAQSVPQLLCVRVLGQVVPTLLPAYIIEMLGGGVRGAAGGGTWARS